MKLEQSDPIVSITGDLAHETIADFADDTLLCHAGRHSDSHHGTVNTPVYHASTILFPTLASLDAKGTAAVRYGRRGTPTSFSLEEAVSALEVAEGTILAPSGAMAISTTLLAFATPGAHYLIPDNVYGPCRNCCEAIVKKLGVAVTYYDPLIGAGIAELITTETTLIWIEAPGSQTFEMSDIGALAAVAKARGLVTVLDNTWAGGYFFKPLSLGIDISLQAGTKYLSGHSDVMLGTISCAPSVYARMKEFSARLGMCVGPDDAYLVLRGMRTLSVRMRQHHASSLKLAEWLQSRPEVIKVMHPGLPGSDGYEVWSRYFSGASGLFGFIIKPVERPRLARMMDGLRLFGMGASWGGYESLLIPTNPASLRTATSWEPQGQTMRIHVGLECVDDLIADLDAGFARMALNG
ncbi:cystathionine beta-lyase [Agrobacterium vitis]|uniref:cystathionine beta-lyase n=1 Tax=Agrobacterium vitis TaxID=373 RepID=UPI0012E79DE8|nr:cystathionine beta-lyase [Agrobacterium vitis]MVA23855.1 cystathionine beta-lyase [Agrobacterium vitis]